MKQHKILIAAIILIFFSGCSKKSPNTPTAPKMVFSLNGLSDITIGQYVDTTFYLALDANYISGPQEQLAVTPDSLPAGVTVTPASLSGTPTFAAVFTFHANSSVSGTFPILVTTTSATTGTKSFHFNLIVTPNPAFTYSISALHDVTILQYVHKTISVAIAASLLTGFTENVTVTPATTAGVSFAPLSLSGKPNFSSSFSMNAAFNSPGTYPVTINSSSPSTTTQAYTFNVIVTPNSDCAPEIEGTYTTTTTCTPTTMYDGVSSYNVEDVGEAGKVNIVTPSLILPANLNCSTGTLTTDATSFSGLSAAAGTGTFTENTIICHYTLSGTINSHCTTSYSR